MTLKLVNRISDCEKYVNKIYNNVITKVKTPCVQTYFYGCAGVGKSFFLYQLSCRLMQRIWHRLYTFLNVTLNSVIHIISAIEHTLFAENKHLVFIIGQVDTIMGELNVYKNQILFVNNLLGKYNDIVSGSANNEVTQIF